MYRLLDLLFKELWQHLPGGGLLLDLLCVSDVYRSTFGFRAGNGSFGLNNESTKGNEDSASSTNTKNLPRDVHKPSGFLFPLPASVWCKWFFLDGRHLCAPADNKGESDKRKKNSVWICEVSGDIPGNPLVLNWNFITEGWRVLNPPPRGNAADGINLTAEASAEHR